MKLKLFDVSQATGLDVRTLQVLAESGKVPCLGALKICQRTKYSVDRKGFEAYQNGSMLLDLGKITKEITNEYHNNNR